MNKKYILQIIIGIEIFILLIVLLVSAYNFGTYTGYDNAIEDVKDYLAEDSKTLNNRLIEYYAWDKAVDLVLFEDNFCVNESYWYNDGNGVVKEEVNWEELNNTLECMKDFIESGEDKQ